MALHPAHPGAIIGHEAVLALLPRLTAQTLLFSGPEGVGRRTVARWYAWGLNRGFPPPSLGEHPDVLEVGPRCGWRRWRPSWSGAPATPGSG